MSLSHLLRVAIAIELMLQAELRQHILVQRIILVLQQSVVIDVGEFSSFHKHSEASTTTFPQKLSRPH